MIILPQRHRRRPLPYRLPAPTLGAPRLQSKTSAAGPRSAGALGAVAAGSLALLVGAAVPRMPMLAIAAAAALLVLATLARSRPEPSALLLALPPSLLLPPVATVSIADRSMEVLFADLVILAAVAAWVLRPSRVDRTWLVLNLLLVAWASLSLLQTEDFGRSLIGLKVVVETASVAVLAASAPRTMLRRFAWSGGFLAIGLTIQLALQGAFRLLGNETSTSSLAREVYLLHNSAATLSVQIGRSNYVAAVIFLGLLGILACWRLIEGVTQRVVAVAIVAVGALGVISTASRSQMLSLVVIGTVVMLGYLGREALTRSTVVTKGLSVLIVLGFAAFVLPRVVAYVSSVFLPVFDVGITDYSTVAGRLDLWRASVTAITSSPFVGVGVFAVELATPLGVYSMSHNFLLQVAAETGLIGLAIYVRLLFHPVLVCRGRYRRVALVLVGGLTLSGLAEPTLRTGVYDYVAWALLGLVVAWGRADTNEGARLEADPVPRTPVLR